MLKNQGNSFCFEPQKPEYQEDSPTYHNACKPNERIKWAKENLKNGQQMKLICPNGGAILGAPHCFWCEALEMFIVNRHDVECKTHEKHIEVYGKWTEIYGINLFEEK